MRALCWNGINDLSVETVPDPCIEYGGDVIIKVSMSSVCGSDLHLISGYVPAMKPGDVLGHEFVGEVVDVGRAVGSLKVGDRVVVTSILGCGQCEHCLRSDFSCCDNTNPKGAVTQLAYGHACAGILGYSHAFGGYAGSHAEYIRVPFAETNVFKVPEGVRDDQAVFVSDAVPTGYHGAEMANIQPGDIVAVWGCGGVGQMAVHCAFLLGAERVIAIDQIPERLAMIARHTRADTLNFAETDVHEALLDMTGGRGPDRCIDCVGMESDGEGVQQWYDKTKQQLRMQTDRTAALRQAIRACRKGGTVSILGAYGGLSDKFPLGAVMNKALTLRASQQPGQRYVQRLFEHIQNGELDPSYLLTHPMPLEYGMHGYDLFKHKLDNCMRVVFQPDPSRGGTLQAGATAPIPTPDPTPEL